MSIYLYTFQYKGFTVEYRVVARNTHVANRFARQQALAWRLAVEELLSWS